MQLTDTDDMEQNKALVEALQSEMLGGGLTEQGMEIALLFYHHRQQKLPPRGVAAKAN